MRDQSPYIVAHRGAAGLAPENTLAAIREGIRQGARAVEVDVRRSADGVLLLMHDERVDRTTDGTGAVDELTWGEIGRLDAGSHFSPRFAGEPVPTLDEALALIVERGVTLLLEVKYGLRHPGIEHQIAEAVQRANAKDHVVVISFDHDWLAHFNLVAPDIAVGPLLYRPGPDPHIPMTRLVSVHWASVILRPAFIRRTHKQGHQALVWTVNDARLMKLLLRLGVDGVVTDRPDLWKQVM